MSDFAPKIPVGDDVEREAREVKNHILFEIATEVAHRGTSTCFQHARRLLH